MPDESRVVKPTGETVGCMVITSKLGPKTPLLRLTSEQIKDIYDRVSDTKSLLYHVAHARN